MGYWCTLHFFDDKKFYNEVVPVLKGKSGDLTKDCLDFLTSHIIGGISHLSPIHLNILVKQTTERLINIANSLDKTFKNNPEYQKINSQDNRRKFLDNIEGYYDFCKFFEYYIFKTCSDFYPHLPLGKGGISRNFNIELKTLSYSILGDFDNWLEFLCGDGTGITNWITSEEVELLFLEKEHLFLSKNEVAKGFLTLLEVAKNNQLGLVMGVDMSEDRLELLASNKLLTPEIWNNKNTNGLLWKR